MLLRVLGVSADGLDSTVVQGLVNNSVVEHQRLEYKSELPGTSQDERREFARDIAAMANGGGGLLLIGLKDDVNDAACEVTPVNLGGEVTRLSQIASSLIEPFLRVDFWEIPIGAGPAGVILVEVPSSQRRPFAVVEGVRLGYYVRTGKSRHPLSEAEVARMYRARGVRLDTVTSRLSALVESVSRRLGPAPPPAIYLAVAPFESYERIFRPDRDTLANVGRLQSQAVFDSTGVGDVLPGDPRPGFKRIDLARSYEPSMMRRNGWVEFHDDGAFLGVILGREQIEGDEFRPGPLRGFYDTRVTCQLVSCLTGYGLLAKHFEVHGELAVRVGIPEEGLPATVTTGPGRSSPFPTLEITTPITTILSADAEDLAHDPGVLRVAAPLLDDLMSAFGWPRCLQLERDGTVILNTWGTNWVDGVRRWTERLGLPATVLR